MKKFLSALFPTFVSTSLAVVACLCLMLGTERRALAYVDPGSGLLILQSVGSAAAAAVYFMRRRIMALFGSKKASISTPMPVAVKSDRKTA